MLRHSLREGCLIATERRGGRRSCGGILFDDNEKRRERICAALADMMLTSHLLVARGRE